MEGTFRERVASRKFLLMLFILLGGTLVLIFPGLIHLFASVQLAPMLTGGEYATLILGSFGVYSGANVMQKKLALPIDNVNMDGE